MRYKVNDYLATQESVLLRVVVALESELEIYGLVGIKNPTELQWFSLPELQHEGFRGVPVNLKEFHNAKVGDLVKVGSDSMCKILAAAGTAFLLSRNIGQKHFNPIEEIVETLAEAAGAPSPIPDEHKAHMRKHNSMTYQQNAADKWVDRDVMALMNWKLVSE